MFLHEENRKKLREVGNKYAEVENYGCLYVAKFNDILYVQQYIIYVQQ